MNVTFGKACEVLAVTASLVLASCGMPKPGEIELAPQGSDALLLLYTTPTTISYDLRVTNFDPNAKQTTESSLGGWVHLRASSGPMAHFVYAKVSPGTYAIHSFQQQLKWALCFHANTYAFSVSPGQVLYLGAFEAKKHHAELNSQVQTHGNLIAGKYEVHHYFDDVARPHVVQVSQGPGSLAHAQEYVTANMPKVRAKVDLASLQNASFGTGYSLTGQRLCGGYFKGAAKN